MSKWIKVKDKRPEDEQTVLCYCRMGELVLRYCESEDVFLDLENCHWYADYWRPLPKPPKED